MSLPGERGGVLMLRGELAEGERAVDEKIERLDLLPPSS